METKTNKDSERYLEYFIQQVKDYRDLTTIEFFMKYCVWNYWNESDEIENDYQLYKNNTVDPEVLTYSEWLEQVYFTELESDIHDRVNEYRESALEVVVYKEASWHNDYKIYEVTLAWGWPNIYVNLSSRWDRATYEFYWGSDIIKENLSYMYDDIFNYLNLDLYDYE